MTSAARRFSLLPIALFLTAACNPWKSFTRENGSEWRVVWNPRTGTPHRISGHYIDLGESVTRHTAAATARRVVERYRRLLKVDPEALLVSNVQWDPTRRGSTGAAIVAFKQEYRGLPVIGGSVRVVIKDRRLTTLASDFMPNIRVPVRPTVPKAAAVQTAQRSVGLSGGAEPVAVNLVVLPRELENSVEYRLSWQVTMPRVDVPEAVNPASTGETSAADRSATSPVQWRLYIDAIHGEVLERENLLYSDDVTGRVTGPIRPFSPNDAPVIMPIAGVAVTGTQGALAVTTTTDVNGDYTLTGYTAASVSIESSLHSPEVRVLNYEHLDPDATHIASAIAPASHNWSWDTDDSSPNDVETQAFYHVTLIRRWFSRGAPFDVIPDPPYGASASYVHAVVRYPGCVSVGGGGEVILAKGGPGCIEATLCSGLIYHEYTHLIVARLYTAAGVGLGTGQLPAMNEGFADYFAATILNRSAPFAECFARDLAPNKRYPRDMINQVHADGTIIGGAIWDVREALGPSYTDALALRALKQAPSTFVEYLAAMLEEDDDPLFSPDPSADNSPGNGTPNIAVICHSFLELHGIYHDYCANRTAKPVAIIISPSPESGTANRSEASVSSLDIVGTVQGSLAGPLQSVAIDYSLESDLAVWRSSGITLANAPDAPITDAQLAQWDVSGLAEGYYILRVSATDAAGQTSEAYSAVLIDRHIMTGWPQQPLGYFPQSPIAVDLDPGYPGLEIIARDDLGKIYVWHADGTIAAGWPRSVAYWPAYPPAIADLDHDGSLDLIAGSATEVTVFAPDGSTRTNWPQLCPTLLGGFMTPALADLDGDGNLEIVVATYEGNVCAWHANGSPVSGWPVARGGHANYPVALGDIDGDGTPEVVVAAGSPPALYVLKRDGSNQVGWPRNLPSTAAAAPVIADVDLDGIPDIILGTSSLTHVWRADGTAISGWPAATGLEVTAGAGMVVADLQSGGTPELLRQSSSKLGAWQSGGTVLPGFPTTFACPFQCGAGSPKPVVGDIDGDGDMESVAFVDSWHVGRTTPEWEQLGSRKVQKVFAVNHDGTVAADWPRYLVGLKGASSPSLADVDQDGRLEVVVGGSGVTVWKLPGSGTVADWPTHRWNLTHTACRPTTPGAFTLPPGTGRPGTPPGSEGPAPTGTRPPSVSPGSGEPPPSGTRPPGVTGPPAKNACLD